MEPHQQRVVDEKTALADKIRKLSAFTQGIVFKSLPVQEQDLLLAQFYCMRHYNTLLAQRIALWAKEEA